MLSFERVQTREGRRLRASTYYRWRPGPLELLAVLAVATLVFLATWQAYVKFSSSLPDLNLLASETVGEDTLVFASDGTTQLADLHEPGVRRYTLPLEAMGAYSPAATVAIEDAGFYTEPGIDPPGIVRAAWIDWREHRAVQGASTITQQLVKLRLLNPHDRSLERKVKEAVLAVELERTHSKRQILEMYLNTVFYGQDAYGIGAAAAVYFHKKPKDLTLGQASMLAGIPQHPTFDNPFTNWKGARLRQYQVLDAMVRHHDVTREEADRAFAEDLRPPEHMFLDSNVVLAPGFVRYVTDQLLARYGTKTVYGGGLRVYTTLNWTLQQVGQAAITNTVSEKRDRNVSQGALVALNPKTGAILAMVGSADPGNNGGQFNMAVWPPRNPGSSMKIYTYTAAIASGGYTMVTPIQDSPIRIQLPGSTEVYQPKNYDEKWHGTCQLQQCMGNSLNVPAVKVEVSIGIDKVVQMARLMGAPPWSLHPDNGQWSSEDPLDYYGPSLTLGGYGETPLQMATGASVLAAMGVLHPPYAIQRITNGAGVDTFKADPAAAAKQVLDPRIAYIMASIMSNDNNRAMIFGRGTDLTLPWRHVAVKTGTTDDFADAWTVGFTPSLVSAVWMGNPDWRVKMTKGSDSFYVAVPAWHRFMQTSLDFLSLGDEWYGEPGGLNHSGGNYFLPGTSPGTPAPQLPYWARSWSPAPPAPAPSPAPSPPPKH